MVENYFTWEVLWKATLKIIVFLLLAFGALGIWFIFHIGSAYKEKGFRTDALLLFFFPIIIIIGTGINLVFDNLSDWLDDIVYLITPFAWVFAYIVYTIFFMKNKDFKKDEG